MDHRPEKPSLHQSGSPQQEIAQVDSEKRVHLQNSLVQIHEIEESADWKEYRKAHWERVALDAHRFVERISNAEKVIGHILSDEHRRKIYNNYISTALSEKLKRVFNVGREEGTR
jgi:hypothetical protein